jgi:hypothetical protein
MSRDKELEWLIRFLFCRLQRLHLAQFVLQRGWQAIVALGQMEYHGWEHGQCAGKTDTITSWRLVLHRYERVAVAVKLRRRQGVAALSESRR